MDDWVQRECPVSLRAMLGALAHESGVVNPESGSQEIDVHADSAILNAAPAGKAPSGVETRGQGIDGCRNSHTNTRGRPRIGCPEMAPLR